MAITREAQLKINAALEGGPAVVSHLRGISGGLEAIDKKAGDASRNMQRLAQISQTQSTGRSFLGGEVELVAKLVKGLERAVPLYRELGAGTGGISRGGYQRSPAGPVQDVRVINFMDMSLAQRGATLAGFGGAQAAIGGGAAGAGYGGAGANYSMSRAHVGLDQPAYVQRRLKEGASRHQIEVEVMKRYGVVGGTASQVYRDATRPAAPPIAIPMAIPIAQQASAPAMSMSALGSAAASSAGAELPEAAVIRLMGAGNSGSKAYRRNVRDQLMQSQGISRQAADAVMGRAGYKIGDAPHMGLGGWFRGLFGGGGSEGDVNSAPSLQTHHAKLESYTHHISEAKRLLQAAGVGAMWETDLHADPHLRSLALSHPGVFGKIEDSLVKAQKWASGSAVESLSQKLAELSRLKQDIGDMRSGNFTPPQAVTEVGPDDVHVLPDTFGKKGSKDRHVSAASEMLMSGKSPAEVAAILQQEGGISAKTAKVYVREAMKRNKDLGGYWFGDVDMSDFNETGLGGTTHHAAGGRANMTSGGVVPRMHGVAPGSDWHPAWLTNDEYVINAKAARKHKDLLAAINADHGAQGGSMGADGVMHYAMGGAAVERAARRRREREQDEEAIDAAYERMYGGRGSRLGAQFGYGGARIAGAAGAGDAAHLFGAGGDIGTAAATGGPAGVAVASTVAALTAFRIGIEKTTSTFGIMNNSFMTTAQKQRALLEEFIPFMDTLHRMSDAINGVDDRVRQAHLTSNRQINLQNAVHQRDTSILAQRRQRNEFRAAAFGMNSHRIAVGRTDFANTSLGDLEAHEQDVRLAAQDALVNANRRVSGAEELVRLQTNQTEVLRARSNQSEAARIARARESRAAVDRENGIGAPSNAPGSPPTERSWGDRAISGAIGSAGLVGVGIDRFRLAFDSAPTGRSWGDRAISGAIGSAGLVGVGIDQLRLGFNTVPRDQGGRAEASGRENSAGNLAANQNTLLFEHERQLQQDTLELQRQRNDQQRVAIGLMQAELQLMTERSNRMRGDTQRLGSMTRGQRIQGMRALELVRHRGDQGFDLLSPHLIQQAEAFAPNEIAGMRRRLGQRVAQDAARSGHLDVIGVRDWQGGNASLGDTLSRERQLGETIRQQLDQVAVTSADRLATTFTGTMDRMADIIEKTCRQMIANFESRMRELTNNVR